MCIAMSIIEKNKKEKKSHWPVAFQWVGHYSLAYEPKAH